MHPQSANWVAKAAWFWAGSAAGCVTYSYFCVPEPKNLTYGQIDELYSEKISVRNFKAAGQRFVGEAWWKIWAREISGMSMLR
jgi:hypothetical protein